MKNKLTRPAFSSIMLLLLFQNLYSQDYLITFSGSGQSSTVEIVEVKNIAQQFTLTLSGTDTLLLTDFVGTGILPTPNQGMVVYPNPANHSSRLKFYNSSYGVTRVEIYDFSGRLLIHKSIQLDAGSHAFSISSLKAGIYILKVNTPDQTYSRRFVSTSLIQLSPELYYEGITQTHPQEFGLKSISNIVSMQYNDDERLVFKAISGDYVFTKSLVPTQSQNIDFEFIECVDVDGNHYGVVTIGEQVWMAENLKTTHYRNGTPIEYPETNNSVWQSNTTGAYAWYANDISWKDSYGALYNWHAVNNTNSLCPSGWHVPSDAEWTELVNFVVAQGFPNESYVLNSAGNALKSCLQVNSPLEGGCNTTEHPRWNSNGTYYGFDEFGFSGLSGGYRNFDGAFSHIGKYGRWWSTTETSSPIALSRLMYNHEGSVGWIYAYKNLGLSVRCLKN